MSLLKPKERPTTAPSASASVVTTVLDVAGMDCADCARDVEVAARELPGVDHVEADASTVTLRVTHNAALAPAKTVAARVTRTGQTAKLKDRHRAAIAPWWRQRRARLLAFATAFTILGYVLERLGGELAHLVRIAFYGAAIAVGGYYPLESAWRSLRRRRVSLNVLLVVATIGAVTLGCGRRLRYSLSYSR